MTILTIQDAEKWANTRILNTTASQETIDKYKIIARRNQSLKRGHDNSDNARIRTLDKAAFRYVAARAIQQCMKDKTTEKALDIYKLVVKVDEKAKENSAKYAGGYTFENAQTRKSKALALKSLPDSWREKIHEHAKSSKYAQELSIMSATGCRPCEFKNGIKVTREYDGSTTFKILGAKQKSIKKGSKDISVGQEWRYITFDEKHLIAASIPEGTYKAAAMPIESAAKHFAEKAFRTSTGRSSKASKVFSAYCFRHQVASDLKAKGVSQILIAAALGHRSVASQQTYGRVRSGGGVCPVLITAASVVRSSPKQEARFKRSKEINTSKQQNVQSTYKVYSR